MPASHPKGKFGTKFQAPSVGTTVIPEPLNALGDVAIFNKPILTLFCSVRCPGSIILKICDCMKMLRGAGVTVISGFHSPVEKECLNILLRGSQPVIVCPAKSLEGMRVKTEYQKPLEEGRLLFLSPFSQGENRASAGRAVRRNDFVAAVADKVLVAYAHPGGSVERLCQKLSGGQTPLLVLDDMHNNHLRTLATGMVGPKTIMTATAL